jgi:hypothetical protein
MAQAVECLPNKHKALSSVPNTAKTKTVPSKNCSVFDLFQHYIYSSTWGAYIFQLLHFSGEIRWELKAVSLQTGCSQLFTYHVP